MIQAAARMRAAGRKEENFLNLDIVTSGLAPLQPEIFVPRRCAGAGQKFFSFALMGSLPDKTQRQVVVARALWDKSCALLARGTQARAFRQLCYSSGSFKTMPLDALFITTLWFMGLVCGCCWHRVCSIRAAAKFSGILRCCCCCCSKDKYFKYLSFSFSHL